MSYNDDNHANQMNPEHDAYWQSRGYDERQDDGNDENARTSSTSSTIRTGSRAASMKGRSDDC